MKKLLAITVCLATLFSFASCGDVEKQVIDKIKDLPPVTITDGETEVEIELPDFSDVDSFEDFADMLEEDFEIKANENEDGSVTVEITTPDKWEDRKNQKDKATVPNNNNKDTDTDTEAGPAIPTIDRVKPTAPAAPVTPSAAPEPENTPEPTPEPAPEPTPAPSPDPEPTPEPEAPKAEEETKQPEPTAPAEPEKPKYTYTSNQKHTALKMEERYLYSLLNDEQKGWYRAIDKAVNNLEARVALNTKLSEDRRYMIYFLYMFDNPKHFYLGNSSTIYTKSDNTSEIIFCYSDGENYCSYGHTPSVITPELKSSILKKKAIFDAEVERIVSTIPSDAPDVVKEKLIYDRILSDSHYNLGARWNGVCEPNWNAYGILVNKYGVCESYSEAFHTLLDRVGIVSTGVVGTAGGGHKWNCVKLDGEWYMCDITFDDPIGGEPGAAYHYYFNLTSAEMIEQRHDWSNSDWPVPECNGTKYSFKNYFGN